MQRSKRMRRTAAVSSTMKWRKPGYNLRFIFILTAIFLILWGLFFAFVLIQFRTVKKWMNIAGNEEFINDKGMRVIVGRAEPQVGTPNYTKAELDEINYNPVPGAGEDGAPVILPPALSFQIDRLFPINGFNILASDKISLDRRLSDFRIDLCLEKKYEAKLPHTSVIVVFHNEAWSTLLRTIHSIINKTPKYLLKEIILVDDDSERAFLKKPLDDYVSNLKASITVIHSEKRLGLVRARLRGAAIAKGKVLTFLDAHVECMDGWLEPLLNEIYKDTTRVVVPIIDVISDQNFGVSSSLENLIGGFNWNLHYRWLPLPPRIHSKRSDISDPIETPVMAGGLFSIDKNFFETIGTYDKGMEIWGGENIEISLRIWLCGGSLHIIPCSHVAHVFRSTSPYLKDIPGGVGRILFGNTLRTAEVWMEELKDFYYFHNKEALNYVSSVNVTARRKLREKLRCKSFTWYLENIWPEHSWPHDYKFFGRIVNKYNGRCIQKAPGSSFAGEVRMLSADIQNCVTLDYFPLQYFLYTNEAEIKTDESYCIDASWGTEDTRVNILPCNGENTQKWKYDPWEKKIVHIISNLCLDLPSTKIPEGLTLQKCSYSSHQQWVFQAIEWKRNS